MRQWNKGWASRGLLSGVLYAGMTLAAMAGGKPVLQDALLNPYPVPSIAGIQDWIHASPSLSLSQYRGKVVLLHFWTYSSINSLRVLPEVAAWQRQYGHRGLVVISIHTPEFGFEKDPRNVARAVSKYNLSWPVALDNNYRTWQNFRNSYWPGLYLVDPSGYVVYQHFGEGDYAITENNIRALLGLPRKAMASTEVAVDEMETPETYMGYDRAERFRGEIALTPDETMAYAFPTSPLENGQWGFQGAWTVHRDRAVAAMAGAKFRIQFNAKQVYAVLGHTGEQPAKVRVWLDGQLVKAGKQGSSELVVGSPDLYQTLALSRARQGTLEIEALSPGVELYTVTFGA